MNKYTLNVCQKYILTPSYRQGLWILRLKIRVVRALNLNRRFTKSAGKYPLYFKTSHKDAKYFGNLDIFYGLIMNLKEDCNITLELLETLNIILPPPPRTHNNVIFMFNSWKRPSPCGSIPTMPEPCGAI